MILPMAVATDDVKALVQEVVLDQPPKEFIPLMLEAIGVGVVVALDRVVCLGGTPSLVGVVRTDHRRR